RRQLVIRGPFDCYQYLIVLYLIVYHAFYPRRDRQRCTLRHVIQLYNLHVILSYTWHNSKFSSFNHAETTKRILMKIGTQTGCKLILVTKYLLSHGNAGKTAGSNLPD
ncbi:hypothetical protein SFRURICE_016965, partial [Spodoptera frugiperda]